MSVVINYVTKYIAIIATDTRISFGRNAAYGYNDDNVKLFNLPNMGWCSGVGYHNFLELFKKKLSKAEVSKPKDIELIFIDSINQTINDSLFPNCEDINSSSVSFSWVSVTPEDMFCRLGIMSKEHFGTNLMSVNFDDFYVLYPCEYLNNEKLVEEFEDIHELRFKVLPNDPDVLRKLLNKIFLMFKHISTISNTVSKTCDVGILLLSQEGLYKLYTSIDIGSIKETGALKLEQVSFIPFTNKEI